MPEGGPRLPPNVTCMITRSRPRPLWARAAVYGLAVLTALATMAPAGRAALPSYPLYYVFQIPAVNPTFAITDTGSSTTYTGKFTGTFGGLPILTGSYSYGGETGKPIGGGWFTLVTDAGAVHDTNLLMTIQNEKTTVLFFGTYLGTHVEFKLDSPGVAIIGSTQQAAGLADTGFPSQDAYVTAVQTAVSSLPAAARDQLIAQANANLRLVTEYQQQQPSH
jgi:hypothetical protein